MSLSPIGNVMDLSKQGVTGLMYSSTIVQAPPIYVVFYRLCDKVYLKQEVRFLLYLLGQIVI